MVSRDKRTAYEERSAGMSKTKVRKELRAELRQGAHSLEKNVFFESIMQASFIDIVYKSFLRSISMRKEETK